ncbi:hypothetical protein [Kitasatospora cineracea]|uniref:hypothetical protein n=1 Tax=Kitasatospora cineracea TaxID=88074 RepID=UPI00380F1278
MAHHRSTTLCAASALFLAVPAGPLVPAAGADDAPAPGPERYGTVALDLVRSEGGADFTDPVTGWASVTLAGDEEPVAEQGFDVGASGRSPGRADTRYRWKRAVVPYQLDPGLAVDKQADIKAAMAHWSSRTPVVFVARTAYDFGSIMHYGPKASSSTGDLQAVAAMYH